MLVEGFDCRSMFITYYNHPYYKDHLAALGYVKDTDWVENLIEIPPADNENIQKLRKLSKWLLKRGNYHKADIIIRARSPLSVSSRYFSSSTGLMRRCTAWSSSPKRRSKNMLKSSCR